MEEIMKPIEGFDGYYISNLGKVYCNRKSNRCIDSSMHEIKPKCGNNKQKYLNVILCSDQGQKTFMVHRLVGMAFVPGYFDGAVINHIDGNNRNNEAVNLEWTTQRDNINKSYLTSSLGPMRNYFIWKLYDPNNNLLGEFSGMPSMKSYITDNKLDTSWSSLRKYGHSKGYKIYKQ